MTTNKCKSCEIDYACLSNIFDISVNESKSEITLLKNILNTKMSKGPSTVANYYPVNLTKQ